MFDSQLKKQAQLRESILVGVIILAICYASYITFYTPQKNKADKSSAKIAELSKTQKDLENQNKILLQRFQQQNQQVQNEQKHAGEDPKMQLINRQRDSAFKNISEFLDAIAQDGFRGSINIDKIKYDLPSRKEGYIEVKFYITANGRFVNVLEFIRKLESTSDSELMTLDVINIGVNKKDANLVNVDLVGTFFQMRGENG